jgi:hypothetical protein
MKKQQFKTPVLFCIFNRPDVTKKTFTTLSKIKPKVLYIAADGARDFIAGEADLCLRTRKVTENINWDCKVFRLYRNSNLGCGKAISSAIDWFFENVDQGIILEDDCLPKPYFFKFVEDMLEKYKYDEKIMHISGDNFFESNLLGLVSPMFTKYPHVWGWATWKRAWMKYDYNMKIWRRANLLSKINSIEGGLLNKLYWTAKFDSVAYKITNTWDYQWIYANFKNSANSVFPSTNLVKNIGFGVDSTHTKKESKNIKFVNKSNTNENINDFEENHVFNANSWKTIINFLYFSVFGRVYIYISSIYFK